MAIPTKISFDDFFKAVIRLAPYKGFRCEPYKGKAASAICFNFFEGDATTPIGIFCVHENKKEKVIYSDDLKKALKQLKVTKDEFEKFIEKDFVL